MSKLDPLWVVTMISPEPGVLTPPAPVKIQAQMCLESNGALIFGGGSNASIKTIIASGQWLMAEKEEKLNE